jgi:hypothetical protein
MSGFEHLKSGTPLPPVNVDDLTRGWDMVKRAAMDQTAEVGVQGSVGIAARLIAEQCEPGANVLAVFFRAALLQHLFQAGLLDEWRKGDRPSDSVFQAGAAFPMEPGVQGFDPAAFIHRLRAP